jgi:glycine/D-amino acid oxidase-like deaminating enzyme
VTNLFNLTLKGSSASSSFLSGFLPTWSSSKGPFSLSLHTHTPANDITDTKSDRHRWKVHTPRGIISTNYVIHATNAYASHLLPHLAGPNGIVPTRGQIIATRAATPSLWKSAFSGNEGFEYWFPRPHKSNEKPLVILGGGREVTKPKYELYETNDAELNPRVSDTLYKFLPAVFPGKFESEGKPEYEWVS